MTVPLGIDVDAYKAADIQDKNKKFTMLFIGSSDPRKRLDFLCDMLMQLEDSIGQDAVLHIVGGVDNKVDEQEAEEIRRTAFVDGSFVQWISKADEAVAKARRKGDPKLAKMEKKRAEYQKSLDRMLAQRRSRKQ